MRTRFKQTAPPRIRAWLVYAWICMMFILPNAVTSQPGPHIDSIQPLHAVIVQGYTSPQPILTTPASIAILHTQQLKSHPGESLLPALNTIPGIRMEERSPGSYRLSIRGSLLRSPFGVRNVKVYLDEFPLTDAGGNTYINLLDPKSIRRIEVLKGPDGSLFGANSGGVVLLNLHGQQHDSSRMAIGLTGGSYGLLHEKASVHLGSNRSQFSFNQAWQQSDGYRDNSAMQRLFLQASERLYYGKKNNIKVLAVYADLHYQTPGGLTQAQYDEDPQQARPAGGTNPGAVEQQAGIYNKTFFGGITNELHLSKHVRHVIAFFGTHTDFKNPFITNYEVRDEKNLGLRTFLEYVHTENVNMIWKYSLGLEGQRGWHDITNYQNNAGMPGSTIAMDEIKLHQLFYFTRLSTVIGEKLTAEAAVSLNTNTLSYTNLATDGKVDFVDQWMPRFALSYLLSNEFAIRASVSRGYSPPTLAETRPSGNVINEHLQAEAGWNKEAGFRMDGWNHRLQLDMSVFSYNLSNAIVRREDPDGAEFFTNAGGTKQTGIESLITAWIISLKHTGFLRAMQLTTSFTYSHFVFHRYQDAAVDYSGNKLTGVPDHVLVAGITLRFPYHINVFIESSSTSRIPLNDGNTIYADPYHVLRAKLSWTKPRSSTFGMEIFAGADNITNETYSLGHDINAFGGRYFNAAPPVNFYGGAKVKF